MDLHRIMRIDIPLVLLFLFVGALLTVMSVICAIQGNLLTAAIFAFSAALDAGYTFGFSHAKVLEEKCFKALRQELAASADLMDRATSVVKSKARITSR